MNREKVYAENGTVSLKQTRFEVTECTDKHFKTAFEKLNYEM